MEFMDCFALDCYNAYKDLNTLLYGDIGQSLLASINFLDFIKIITEILDHILSFTVLFLSIIETIRE